MRRSFFEILKSFFASKEISAEIHRKNRETVVKIFWFSIIFALLEFAARIVFDLPNTLTSKDVRGKEYQINETETIKIGQFEANKARLVLKTNKPDNNNPLEVFVILFK